jgi:hypothetical protein
MLKLEAARQNGTVSQWQPGWWTANRRYMQPRHGRRVAVGTVVLVTVAMLTLVPWTPSTASCVFDGGVLFRTGVFVTIIAFGTFASAIAFFLARVLSRHAQGIVPTIIYIPLLT